VTLLANPAELKSALAAAGAPAAVLAEGPAAPELPVGMALAAFTPANGPHPAGCNCCAGRSPAAAALDALFQGRVRGHHPWFTRVLALPASAAGRAEIQAALESDAVTMARFRAG
jgi:hypothetical protein